MRLPPPLWRPSAPMTASSKLPPRDRRPRLDAQPPIVDGVLHGKVKGEECMWQLQDSHRLIVSLPKLAIDKHEWWPSW